ncbi:GFA family protein [Piscinibacterium candidicorallinum]|uniref:GFA family protein n=1 Tax=Piscinibacterium candidicorallinum TaxID=1793872 RepID=A0ABV7H8R0_9BURK
MDLHGSCHCGNIRFSLAGFAPEAPIPARACTCSFCQKHGGVWTSHPQGRLRIRIAAAADHGVYRFGTGTADFHVCRRCGSVPAVTSEVDGRLFGVVSVRALEGVAPERLQYAQVSFEGEAIGDRLARRARGWIPDVDVLVGEA